MEHRKSIYILSKRTKDFISYAFLTCEKKAVGSWADEQTALALFLNSI